MWSSSKKQLLFQTAAMLGCLVLLMLLLTGCISDSPSETDIPWAAPASWEGVMPMPGGFVDRYQ